MEFNNIENLDEMIWAYESFLQDVELKLKRGKSIKDLCSKLMRREIFNIAHRAIQEIKKSVMSSNDSQNQTVKFYKKEAKRIEACFNQQISKYELNHVKNIYSYQHYYNAIQPLYDFISNMDKFEISQHKTELDKPQIIKVEEPTLSGLIAHKKSVEIVSGIKMKYKNIQGKRLKLLLLAFQELDLLPRYRIASKFHKCCSLEFDWPVASYNAMTVYEFNKEIDTEEFGRMKKYLETFTKSS